MNTMLDGWGDERQICRGCLITFGDGWGSLKGFCTVCKHTANVGCRCVLKCNGGVPIDRTEAERRRMWDEHTQMLISKSHREQELE